MAITCKLRCTIHVTLFVNPHCVGCLLLLTANLQSLEVDYSQMILDDKCKQLAVWLADSPRCIISLLDAAARELVFRNYPEYENIHEQIFVRVTNLPIDDNIRDLRCVGGEAVWEAHGSVWLQ